MGSTNFQIFNPGFVNSDSDAIYTVDPLRTGGIGVGAIVPSATLNKVLAQNSSGVAALMQSLANKGFNAIDSNYTALVTMLANILTTADVRTNLSLVSYSPNPVFNAALNTKFQMTLTGNVASSTLTGAQAGDIIQMCLIQDSVGNRSFVWPSNMIGATNISLAANSATVLSFFVESSGPAVCITPYAPAQIASAGYQRLPNGLLFQWGGVGGFGPGTSVPITFPLVFNQLFVIAIAPDITANQDTTNWFAATSRSNSGFSMYQAPSGGAWSQALHTYIAIGT
jgi:hypothetical protein